MSRIYEHEGHNAALDAAYVRALELEGIVAPRAPQPAAWPIPRRVQKLLALVVHGVVSVSPFAF